ncbi:MAG: serine hydrolase [Ruminococcus sp.]|nr:serine hydrolase [Ruminococcus sp.]
MNDSFTSIVSAPDSGVFSALVTMGGQEIFAFGGDERRPVYSATKSFLSAAAGIAVTEKKFDLLRPALHYLNKEQTGMIKDHRILLHLQAYRIRDFLSMKVCGYPFRPEGDNWERQCLAELPKGFDYAGEPRFHYSNITAYILGLCLENAVDMHLYDYMKPRLFDPLDIRDPVYANCPSGHFYGASGMELNVRELSRLGQLFMNKGSFDGQRIFSEGYAAAATSVQTVNREGGYGYFIWTLDDCFYISGKWGQKCIVFPEKELIVTYLSHLPEDSDRVLKAALDYGRSL